MRNKKRFAALALATVLAVSQVTAVAPTMAVVAEETTDGSEAENEDTTENNSETENTDGSETSESSDEESTDSTEEDMEEDEESSDETESDGQSADDETDDSSEDGVLAGMSLLGSSVTTAEDTGSEETDSSENEEEEEDSESWWIDISWQNDTDQLLVGETVSEIVYLGHHYYYEDDEDSYWADETVATDGYTYKLSYDSDSLDVSEDTTEDGDGLILNITGLEEGEIPLTVSLYVNGTRVAKKILILCVTNSGYYYLTAETMDEIVVPLGKNYDVTEAGFELYYVSDSGSGAEPVLVDDDTYALKVEDCEEYCFNSLDGTTLLNRIHTDGTYAYVAAYSKADEEWLAGTSISFAGLNYNIDLSMTDDSLSGYDHDYVVYGYEQTIALSQSEGDAYNLPDDYYVTWDLLDDTGLLSIVNTDDKTYVTIKVAESDTGYDDWWSGVCAKVWYGDEDDAIEIASNEIWFEIVIPSYSTDEFPSDLVLVINEPGYVELEINSWVRSYENPEGEDTSINLTIDSIDDGYEEYFTIEESGTGLDITGVASTDGEGIEVPYTYTDPLTGDEVSGSFHVYVQGIRYEMWGEYLDETSEMLPGATKEIETYLYYYETDDEDSYSDGYIDDYESNGFDLNIDESSIDTDIFTVEISDEDPSQLIVTSYSSGGQNIYAYITDEADEVVADTYIWVNVTDYDGYYILSADDIDLGLGETVDMNALSYSLTYYYTDADGKNQKKTISLEEEDYYFEIEWYDDNYWTAVDGTELTRTGTWGTNVDVHIMLYSEDSEEYEEVASCGVWFNELDYSSELTASYDGVETSNLIVGETATITLEESWKNDYAFPDGYEVNYEVYVDDDGWRDALDYDAEWSVEDNVLSLTVASAEYSYIVVAWASYEENDFSWPDDLWLSSTEESVTYYAESDAWLILKGYSTTLHAYQIVYSTEYPEGEVTELQITNVAIKQGGVYDDDDAAEETDSAVEIGEFTESGTEVTGIYYGWDDLYVYVTVDGEEILCSTDNDDGETVFINVTGGYNYLDLDESYTINLQDEDNTITLSDILHLTYLDENGRIIDIVEEFDCVSFDWYSEEDDEYYASYDESVVSVSEEDGVITITGLEEGETGLQITVYGSYVDESGETVEYEIDSTWITIYVQGKYDAEITASDGSEAVTEYTETYGAEFNLDLITNSDYEEGIQYKVIEGTDVVTVDEYGNVTAIGVGTAVIKAWVEEGDTYYETEITITVTVDKADAVISGTNSYTVTYGTTSQFYLEDITKTGDGTLSYEVTSGSAVSVDSTGLVKVLSTGTAVITVSTSETDLYNAATLTVAVTVNAAASTETTATETETETESLYIIEAATDDEYTIGKDSSAVIKCNGELSEFVSVAVDGVTVDSSNYTLTEGSTIITFTQDYMDTLSVGVHTVTLTYTENRTVNALLTVKDLTSDSGTESETETTATGSETATESETTATESETDVSGSETDVNGNETDVSGSETDASGSETDVDGTETDADASETDESDTETESETTATETTATETTATESETNSETDSSVATGDRSPIEIYVAVMLLAMSILMAGTLYRRMNRNAR